MRNFLVLYTLVIIKEVLKGEKVMEEKDVVMILSKRYNKKVQVVENMIKICYKFNYQRDDINELFEEFFDNTI